MVQMILIGLAAGGASALLFASVASGSLLSIPLFYLSPLPIVIAALGWSHAAGLIAALAAAAALAFAFNWIFLVSFLLAIGLPAWWLGYLALLARPGAAPGSLEWYPVGRLVLWATLLGGAVVVLAVATFGMDAEAFKAGLRTTLERVLRLQGRNPESLDFGAGGRGDAILDFMVAILPPVGAVLTSFTNVVGLWLGARVVRISGRLRRPWPDLAGMTFPRSTLPAFAIILAATFVPGIVGIAATVLSASFLLAFALLGLAATHALTRGLNARAFILWGVYGAIAVFGWPILLMSVLGLAEATFDLRNRFAGGGPPPATPTLEA